MRDLLAECGDALYGHRFQRELAEALGVNERTMRRWIAGEFAIPSGVAALLVLLCSARRDELKAIEKKLRTRSALEPKP